MVKIKIKHCLEDFLCSFYHFTNRWRFSCCLSLSKSWLITCQYFFTLSMTVWSMLICDVVGGWGHNNIKVSSKYNNKNKNVSIGAKQCHRKSSFYYSEYIYLPTQYLGSTCDLIMYLPCDKQQCNCSPHSHWLSYGLCMHSKCSDTDLVKKWVLWCVGRGVVVGKVVAVWWIMWVWLINRCDVVGSRAWE